MQRKSVANCQLNMLTWYNTYIHAMWCCIKYVISLHVCFLSWHCGLIQNMLSGVKNIWIRMCCSTTTVNPNLNETVNMHMCVCFETVLKKKSGYENINITISIQVKKTWKTSWMKSVPRWVSQDGVRLTQSPLSSNVMCNGRKDILNGRSRNKSK